MSVVLRNNNTTLSMDQFEVYDNVCDTLLGVFTLKGGESRSVMIAQDSKGKGSVKLRNLDKDPDNWVEITSIASGDLLTV